MKISNLLTEMPMNIEDLDWHDLYDADKNQRLYKELSVNKYKKKLFQVFSHATVYQLKSQFFCLDDNQKRVTYFMKYEVGNNGKIGDFVWQSLVWSHEGSPYLSGIPQQIFFDQLLPKFGTIITDSQQTWHGKRFWKLRIAEAFKKGLNVYFYDFQKHEIVKVDDYSNFEKIESHYDVWGNSNIHQMKRMVISNKELPISK